MAVSTTVSIGLDSALLPRRALYGGGPCKTQEQITQNAPTNGQVGTVEIESSEMKSIKL